jgi:hypothetical protein
LALIINSATHTSTSFPRKRESTSEDLDSRFRGNDEMAETMIIANNFDKSIPLLQKCYRVILRIYGYAGKFPRAQKPVLAACRRIYQIYQKLGHPSEEPESS